MRTATREITAAIAAWTGDADNEPQLAAIRASCARFACLVCKRRKLQRDKAVAAHDEEQLEPICALVNRELGLRGAATLTAPSLRVLVAHLGMPEVLPPPLLPGGGSQASCAECVRARCGEKKGKQKAAEGTRGEREQGRKKKCGREQCRKKRCERAKYQQKTREQQKPLQKTRQPKETPTPGPSKPKEGTHVDQDEAFREALHQSRAKLEALARENMIMDAEDRL